MNLVILIILIYKSVLKFLYQKGERTTKEIIYG